MLLRLVRFEFGFRSTLTLPMGIHKTTPDWHTDVPGVTFLQLFLES